MSDMSSSLWYSPFPSMCFTLCPVAASSEVRVAVGEEVDVTAGACADGVVSVLVLRNDGYGLSTITIPCFSSPPSCPPSSPPPPTSIHPLPLPPGPLPSLRRRWRRRQQHRFDLPFPNVPASPDEASGDMQRRTIKPNTRRTLECRPDKAWARKPKKQTMIKYTQRFRNMFTASIAAVVASMVTSSLLEMAKSFAVSRD